MRDDAIVDSETIKNLARGPKLSNDQLNTRLRAFRDNGVGILLCTIFVMENRECSLAEARDIVINSSAWFDQREAFLKEQEEAMQEFIDHNSDHIACIQQAMTPDGTQTTVHLKPRDKPTIR